MRGKILVVDDDELNLRLLESQLSPLGHQVFLARSGEDALEQIPTILPDLVLLDIMMPGMDGFEAAEAMKADPLTAQIPIVMVTSLNQVQARVRALEAGADDFLSKPVDKTELRTRVMTLLKVKAYNDTMSDFQERLALEVDKRTKKLQEANAKIQASLEEKEVLVHEIHHRVKNNLQLISSLLSLQSTQLNDPGVTPVFQTCLNRIKSMALVHDSLYQLGDLSRIELDNYLEELVSHLKGCYSSLAPGVRIDLEVQAFSMDISRAVPCGLILNELISNALRHGFPHGKGGNIFVSMSASDSGRCTIQVNDNGVGLDKSIKFEQSETLGMQLVTALVQQLKGTFTVKREQGTNIRITFPNE